MPDQNATLIRLARRKVDEAIAIGDSRGWERPAGYSELAALAAAVDAARRTAAAGPPPIAAPTTPKQVDAYLDQVVAARAVEGHRHAAADDLVVDVDRQIARLGHAVVAQYLPQLIEAFRQHVTDYQALAVAPRTLTGHESPEETEAHLALKRGASDLTLDLASRVHFAQVTGEIVDLGRDLYLWLILDASPNTSLDAVILALKQLNANMPNTVEDWDTLVPLGLGLARVGEAQARTDRNAQAMHTRGMTDPAGQVESGDLVTNGAARAGAGAGWSHPSDTDYQ